MPLETTCTPDETTIQSIKDVYVRGMTLEALKEAEQLAPLHTWHGARQCVLAARLAANTGAPHLALRLAVRARRTESHNPDALAQYGYEVLNRRGALALWMLMRREFPEKHDRMADDDAAELIALKSCAAADLRDFAVAESLIELAEKLDPKSPWIRLQKARLLHRLDRVEEALEVATSATALHPHPYYRPAVQTCAALLQELDRDDDAIRLLTEATGVIQNSPTTAQLYSLLAENHRWREAAAALDRFVSLSPLMEKSYSRWVLSQRARIKYHLGQRSEAAGLASQLDDEFQKRFAKRLLEPPPEPERVQLDVTFVRQHFKTCAPATLAAIGQYWSMPSEHIKLAEAMCYDGTPYWQQRDWAEKNGWRVIEFRVTWDNAVALTERGLPFTISTVDAASAHMMAVIGFDRARSTLLLRDPSQPYVIEVDAEEFLTQYRPFGPRGAVFVPAGESGRLTDLALTDSDVYDHYHRFSLALSRNERAEAQDFLGRMESAFGEHDLVWEARLDLASYDANISEQARCLDKLLETFPGNTVRLLRRLTCLNEASRVERLAFLRRICSEKADPSLLIELARALQDDARSLPEAVRLLERAQRLRPLDSNGISVWADLHWQGGDLQGATELYRFAANIEDLREYFYRSWFVACRQTRRTEEALAHLEDRFSRFGRRSEQPALTLAWALCEMEQPAKACSVLAAASDLRPADGILPLRAATLIANLNPGESDRLLQSAKGKVRENDWLRAAMSIAEAQLDMAAALRWSRQILAVEPLAMDAHAVAARGLAQLEGQDAALVHLKDASLRFPHHYGLKRMIVNWSHPAGSGEVERAVRELIRTDPSDAWARRELALTLVQLNRGGEALEEAMEAVRIEPLSSYSSSVLACVHDHLQQTEEARKLCRRAIELSVDNSDALQRLMRLAATDKDRREELAYVEGELRRQVVAGDGLLAFVPLARPFLDPETLLNHLLDGHRERPDLWQTWAAVVSQLGHLKRLDDALQYASEASERFSHLPRIWLDLALAHQWRDEPDAEIAAAERGFEINPSWADAAAALAGALERQGRLDDARRVYQRALQHSSNDAQLHAFHGHLLWRLRIKEEAFHEMERALLVAPGYEWAWGQLERWSAESGDAERVERFARLLSVEHPGDSQVWTSLAKLLRNAGKITEGLEALDRALTLIPHSAEVWSLNAEMLTQNEQFDAARKACKDGEAVCSHDTYLLRARTAWIEAQLRNLPAAVRLMREVLSENSGYAVGWTQLAFWLSEQGELPEAARAFEKLRQLRPYDAWASTQLGLLWLKQGDKPAAKQAFVTALQIEPSDPAAAHNLFDLQLDTGDLSGAGRTLQTMQTHQPGSNTLAVEILLLTRRKDKAAALKALEALSLSPDPEAWAMDAATQAFIAAGWAKPALKTLRRAAHEKACNPQTGAAVVRLLTASEGHLRATLFFCGLKDAEVQRRAAAPLIEGLAASKVNRHQMKRYSALRWLMWRRRTALAGDDAAWGQVGYALIQFNRMRACAKWHSDWRERPAAQPWMLFNLCLALRTVGRYEESGKVARHVLQSWSHREGATDFHLFMAVEEALNGSLEAARHHLGHSIVRENVPYDANLFLLAKSLIEFLEAPAAARRSQFGNTLGLLSTQFSWQKLLFAGRDVRRSFRRAGRVFVREGAGPTARLWFFWKLDWHWLLAPLWLGVTALR